MNWDIRTKYFQIQNVIIPEFSSEKRCEHVTATYIHTYVHTYLYIQIIQKYDTTQFKLDYTRVRQLHNSTFSENTPKTVCVGTKDR